MAVRSAEDGTVPPAPPVVCQRGHVEGILGSMTCTVPPWDVHSGYPTLMHVLSSNFGEAFGLSPNETFDRYESMLIRVLMLFLILTFSFSYE